MNPCPVYPPATPCPTQAGFLTWVRSNMGVPVAALPDNSADLVMAFNLAFSLVNQKLTQVPGPIFQLVVYNLAGAFLVEYAGDVTPPYYYPTNNPPDDEGPQLTYFAYLRNKFNLNGFVSGVVQSTSDESSSVSLVTPKAFENLTLMDLQLLATPWGRAYLGLAQKVGSLWGLSGGGFGGFGGFG